MVGDEASNNLIKWSDDGHSFIGKNSRNYTGQLNSLSLASTKTVHYTPKLLRDIERTEIELEHHMSVI